MSKIFFALVFVFSFECFAHDVVFVGDSITTGSYPSYFCDILKENCLSSCRVYARTGATSDKISGYVFDAIIDGDFSDLVVYAGINDCEIERSRSEVVIDNIRYIAELGVLLGVKVVVLTIHVDTLCSERINDWLYLYSDFYLFDVIDTDVFSGADSFFNDGIHLTELGNIELAEALFYQRDWSC